MLRAIQRERACPGRKTGGVWYTKRPSSRRSSGLAIQRRASRAAGSVGSQAIESGGSTKSSRLWRTRRMTLFCTAVTWVFQR